MLARRPLVLWGALVLGLLLLLCGVWWFALSAPRQAVRLSDGREIVLAKVTYGTQHRYVHGQALARAVAPFMSAQWRRRQDLRTIVCTSATPAITMWVIWQDAGGTNQNPSTAAIGDESGDESEPAWLGQLADVGGGRRVVAWTFRNFPRHLRTLVLKVHGYHLAAAPRTIAEFVVPNPAPTPRVARPVPALPSTHRDGDLACTLLHWTAGKPAPVRRVWPESYHANWNTALFQISERGTNTLAWSIAGITAVDENGNIADTRRTVCTPVGEYLLAEFDGAFWRGHQIWKMDVEASRTAQFASNELWSVPAVPVPGTTGTPSRIPVQATVQGLHLKNLVLARLPPPGPSLRRFMPNAVVDLEAAEAVPGTRVTLVRAIDDAGRNVPHEPRLTGTNTIHSHELRLAPGTMSVDFTFAVHRSRFFEFLAKPAAEAVPPDVPVR